MTDRHVDLHTPDGRHDPAGACRTMEAIELKLQPGCEDACIDNLVLP